MTPQAKRRLAQRQRNAFNKARAAGHRYFYFDGNWYNTKKAGESDAYWVHILKTILQELELLMCKLVQVVCGEVNKVLKVDMTIMVNG